jgi:putative ABC transport system permease protein
MDGLIVSIITQSLTFLPLAFGIGISYTILRATDMTLEASFVLGAAIFARLITLGAPPAIAAVLGLFSGFLAGIMVAFIQRGGRVDPLLAGILATFILTSGNLLIMGRPNISLLSQPTLVSTAFTHSNLAGWSLIGLYTMVLCGFSILLIITRFGLALRALGDNPGMLTRLGMPVELYRMLGFGFTNTLAASAGILTAQTVGYADTSMGFGMTLTGIGAIIIGQQMIVFLDKTKRSKTYFEFTACVIGVLFYFMAINLLLRFDVDPVYLKMLLGLILILFLRTAMRVKR